MIRRSVIALFASAFALFMLPGVSLAADENHVAEAITHTREAINDGLEGKASSLVEHLRDALEHATAAQKEKSNRFVRAGIVHLKKAIKHGEKGHATIATRHAKEALAKLDHAPH